MRNKHSKLYYCRLLWGIVFLLLIPSLPFAAEPAVFVSVNIEDVTDGKVAHLFYDAEGRNQTTGLGIRVHYNSSECDGISVLYVLKEGLLAFDQNGQADTEDFDRDPSTDRYINFAWMDITGHWPQKDNFPVKLGEINFKQSLKQVTPAINVTSSSVPAGYRFEAR